MACMEPVLNVMLLAESSTVTCSTTEEPEGLLALAEAPEHGARGFRSPIRSPHCGIVLLHHKGADSAHAANSTRKHENATRHHLPSINSGGFFFSYRDSLPPRQLYANFPSALLYYHSEQMLQPLQNAEVTKPINPAQQPGWASSSCDREGLSPIPLLHQTPTMERDQKPTSGNTRGHQHRWIKEGNARHQRGPKLKEIRYRSPCGFYSLGPNMHALTC